MAPSSWHGVTTVVMGNCGVGFAPAAPDRREWLVGLMEGVEDIPGSALTEGMTWNWESFPEYLDALEGLDRTVDVAAQVPHGAVRAYVMGERGAAANQEPTETEIARMSAIVEEGLASWRRRVSPPRAPSSTSPLTVSWCPVRLGDERRSCWALVAR